MVEVARIGLIPTRCMHEMIPTRCMHEIIRGAWACVGMRGGEHALPKGVGQIGGGAAEGLKVLIDEQLVREDQRHCRDGRRDRPAQHVSTPEE